MKKIILQIKNYINKGLAPYEAGGFRSGFVILFAVVLSAMLLSITLGITNITLNEIKFATSARDTNDAFLAADTGIECALMNDKGAASKFPLPGAAQSISCAAVTPTMVVNNGPIYNDGDIGKVTYTFYINGLGSSGNNCARVQVIKDDNTSLVGPPYYVRTSIISKGYNVNSSQCIPSTNSNRVERQIEVDY